MWRSVQHRWQNSPKGNPQWQPIDRAAWLVIAALVVAIAALLVLGDRSAARVRDFSWADRTIGADDRAFVLAFNRPMNRDSVEANLKLDPPLEGKVSWAGTRMAFTLDRPAPYGTSFQLQLGAGARDTREDSKPAESFSAAFRSRDRVFAYIGTEGEEAGRLILYELTQQRKTILTPPNLLVNDFKPYPNRDRILFSATETSTLEKTDSPSLLEQQFYTVTTGLSVTNQAPEPAGEVMPVLDNRDYQNLKFDLAPDGSAALVQRAERKNASNVSLWLLRDRQTPQKLESQGGGEFVITPDSQSIAITQGQGVAILPLPKADMGNNDRYRREIQPLDFLPKFGTVLGFASDGSAAALVKFNGDFTRSLFVVTPSGETELARIQGSILRAEFTPDNRVLYALVTQRVEDENYREQPYIGAFDLKTKALSPLLLLPEQLDIALDLSPDGAALLFDQIDTKAKAKGDRADQSDQSDQSEAGEEETTQGDRESGRGNRADRSSADPEAARRPEASDGNKIEHSQLWLLPVAQNPDGTFAKLTPQALPLPGARPRWLP